MTKVLVKWFPEVKLTVNFTIWDTFYMFEPGCKQIIQKFAESSCVYDYENYIK